VADLNEGPGRSDPPGHQATAAPGRGWNCRRPLARLSRPKDTPKCPGPQRARILPGHLVTTIPSEDDLDAIFTALANRTRRFIVTELTHGEATVKELARPFDMSDSAVSQHIQVLERAGLIARGRHRKAPCRLEPDALRTALAWIERRCQIGNERFGRLDEDLNDRRQDKKNS